MWFGTHVAMSHEPSRGKTSASTISAIPDTVSDRQDFSLHRVFRRTSTGTSNPVLSNMNAAVPICNSARSEF